MAFTKGYPMTKLTYQALRALRAESQETAFAPLDSAVFTGVPTIPTPPPLAQSTEWVNARWLYDIRSRLNAMPLDSPIMVGPASMASRPGDLYNENVAATAGGMATYLSLGAGKAQINSPNFTGPITTLTKDINNPAYDSYLATQASVAAYMTGILRNTSVTLEDWAHFPEVNLESPTLDLDQIVPRAQAKKLVLGGLDMLSNYQPDFGDSMVYVPTRPEGDSSFSIASQGYGMNAVRKAWFGGVYVPTQAPIFPEGLQVPDLLAGAPDNQLINNKDTKAALKSYREMGGFVVIPVNPGQVAVLTGTPRFQTQADAVSTDPVTAALLKNATSPLTSAYIAINNPTFTTLPVVPDPDSSYPNSIVTTKYAAQEIAKVTWTQENTQFSPDGMPGWKVIPKVVVVGVNDTADTLQWFYMLLPEENQTPQVDIIPGGREGRRIGLYLKDDSIIAGVINQTLLLIPKDGKPAQIGCMFIPDAPSYTNLSDEVVAVLNTDLVSSRDISSNFYNWQNTQFVAPQSVKTPDATDNSHKVATTKFVMENMGDEKHIKALASELIYGLHISYNPFDAPRTWEDSDMADLPPSAPKNPDAASGTGQPPGRGYSAVLG